MSEAEKPGKFYVYRIFDLGGTIYVGKGSGGRLQKQIKRFAVLGEIVKWFKSEREAYAHERRLIEQLKPVLNRCAGGGGPRKGGREPRRFPWEIEMERIGTRVYAARGLLRFDLRPYLPESKIDQIRQVAYGGGP